MRRLLIGFIAVVVSITTPAGAQWIGSAPTDPATPLKTGSFMAIGPGVPPYADTSLRLGIPAGSQAWCTGTPPIGRCLQLAFGTSGGQYWGFRLDANLDLHLDRHLNGWFEGVVFSRSGDVTFPGNVNLPNTQLGVRVSPYADTALRLAFPAGNPDSCDSVDRGVGRCFQLALGLGTTQFGYAAGQYWGLRLDSSLDLRFDRFVDNVGWAEGVKFSRDGKVTIGTTPGDNTERLLVNGKITATSVIGAVYQDVAEWVPVTDQLPAGTVVVVDDASANTVTSSSEPYDTRVAGVVSAQPGLLLGVESPTKAMIATVGRVKVHVSAVNGAIAMGDLLVTSDQPGVAMRSQPLDLGGAKIHRPGTLIGKALEPLASGEGEILVLLSLQ